MDYERNDPHCRTCRSVTGVERISPAPPILETEHWSVEHAYPTSILGWTVIVLKRHVPALNGLTPEESAELYELLPKVIRAIHSATGSEKEYVMCLAEGEGFRHVHVHVIARSHDMPEHLIGTKVFSALHAPPEEVQPPEAVAGFCDVMAALLRSTLV